MRDRYITVAELERAERRGIGFQTVVRPGSTEWAVLAPHGGGIEPGTSELARAIAGTEHSLYLFEGLRLSGNSRLHITSTNFDDPTALLLLQHIPYALTIHGSGDRVPRIAIGGLDTRSGGRILDALRESGLPAEWDTDEHHPGTSPRNLCNRSARGTGVQLECSLALRRMMFSGLSRSARTHTTGTFETLVGAVRRALTIDRSELL
jgi:phage replication-related protein YjqB (UPF0714/DUF867 family)